MSRISNPKVSIILPVFNTGKFLAQSIDSLLSQTFGDFELCIADDGSSDKTVAIGEQYARMDTRIRFQRNECNRGISPTMNMLIGQARGTYIARMDGDDIAYPARIERQVAFLESHSNHLAAGTRFRLIDGDGDVIWTPEIPLDHESIDTQNMRGIGSAICHPTAMIRRAAFEAVGPYSEDFPYAEDLDLFLRIAEAGKLANLDQVLLDYRQHIGAIGYSKRQQQRSSCVAAAQKAAIRRNLKMDIKETEPTNIDYNTLDDILLKWCWWSLSDGNFKTCRKYLSEISIIRRFSFAFAKLSVLCALRRRSFFGSGGKT